MAKDDLPESARRFVRTYIDSVEQLRVLILLFDQPQKSWTLVEITRELRSSVSSISKRLDDLYSRRVLSRNDTDPTIHSFALIRPDLRDVVAELYDLNKSHPYSVIELIYTRPNEAVLAFADAFKFKKEEDK